MNTLNFKKLKKRISNYNVGKKELDNWYDRKYTDLLMGPVTTEIIEKIPTDYAISYLRNVIQHLDDYTCSERYFSEIAMKIKEAERCVRKRLL